VKALLIGPEGGTTLEMLAPCSLWVLPGYSTVSGAQKSSYTEGKRNLGGTTGLDVIPTSLRYKRKILENGDV